MSTYIRAILRSAIMALIGIAATTTHLEAQPGRGGRLLRDVGGRVRERPAPVIPEAMADSAPRAAQPPQPRFRVIITPTVQWEGSQRRFGGQVKLKSASGLPFSVSLTDMVIHSDGEYANRIQGDGQLDVFERPTPLVGIPASLSIFGELQHTSGDGTLAEAAAALDFTLVENSRLGSLTLGVLGYYDHLSPVSGSSESGVTLGTEAIWELTEALEVNAEYDFQSAFNGEDSFSAKLLVAVPYGRTHPTLIFGAAKHGTFLFGLRLER